MDGSPPMAAPPTTPFAACAVESRRLFEALGILERACGALRLPPLAGREWYEILHRKLLPQLAGPPFVVAAVVGGTNIGKSVIFNHLAGARVSATSPLASGTRHPVCLVPEGFEKEHDLAAIFRGFRLIEWTEPDAALENCPEHRLFWKPSAALPANLLVLDTPDIDSDAEINWLRADHLRHCADVLIAVLTQQKYNDAAVKRFFRNAAEEDKAVIALFNQCLLPEDEQFWPLWLETFSRETGIVPDLLYVAPNDRQAAEENRLPFYERVWDPENPQGGGGAPDHEPHDLARDLSEMRFSEIKLRTLRGALGQILAPQIGVRAYLEEIRLRSAAFQDASALLTMQELARVDNWPAPPVGLLVSHIREWWRTHRRGWTKTIHDVYGTLGDGLLWPFRWVREKIAGGAADPREDYRTAERDVMLQTVDSLYGELTRLSQLGNNLLRPRLEALLAGASRAELLERLAADQNALDLDAELNAVVSAQMQAFRDENPNTFGIFRKLDAMAAVARPVTSVVLFAAAAGPIGHMVTTASQSLAVHIIGDIAGGTGAVVVGETALSGTVGGLRLLEARFRQLQAAFTARRVAWFAEFLRKNILGELHNELACAAGLAETTAYKEVLASVERLSRLAPR
ncbi:MAG: GTPase domain-containing protein [Deltaproteobacteria bacterium]